MWITLVPTLTTDVSRFIWFQGESDADLGLEPGAPLTTAYLGRLRDLVARIRALTNPDLFVVVCGLTNYPDGQQRFDAIRAQQQLFAATDRNAIYLSTLDLPSEQSQHLTDEGYRLLAARIGAMAVPRPSTLPR